MDFNEVEYILSEANLSTMLKRDPEREANYRRDLKTIKSGEKSNAKPENKIRAKILKRDLYRYDTKSDLMHQETEKELESKRREVEKDNIEKITADNENFKKSVENFLHKNISQDFKATKTDIRNFNAAIHGNGPDNSERWKRVMIKALAIKPWQQNTEEKLSEKRTKEYLNKLGYREAEKMIGEKMTAERKTYGAQGNYVTVSAKDYNVLAKNMPETYQEKKDGANKIVSRSDARKFNLTELSKSNDFWFITDNGAKTVITFKSVERNGGTQLHQITDVQTSSKNFKSNYKDRPGETRYIAVIRGDHIKGLIAPYIKKPYSEEQDSHKDPVRWEAEQNRKAQSNSGWISYKGVNYGPVDIKINGKNYKFPKIMTEGEWARCMQILAKVYRKGNV